MCCARVICCGSTQMEYKEALNTRCHMAAGILLTMQLRDDCLESECYGGNYHTVQGSGANHRLRMNATRKITVVHSKI